MQYEIERTLLQDGSSRTDRQVGIERFVERGDDPREAVRRFLSRDRSELTGDLITLGEETLATARNRQSVYLLRLHPVEERARAG